MADQFTAGETFTEDEQVTFQKLNLAQTNLKFTTNAVDDSTTAISSEAIIVKSGGITATQLASDAVTEVKILNGAVTANKLGADCVSGPKIADNSISAEHYTDYSIHEEHLNDDVISGQAALAEVPALDDTMLVSDTGTYGNLKKLEFMKYLPLPRAYGILTHNGLPSNSNALAAGSYGVTCTNYSADGHYTFDLTNAMATTTYSVITQVAYTDYWDDDKHIPGVEIVDTNTFKIHSPYPTTTSFHFVVFGTLG